VLVAAMFIAGIGGTFQYGFHISVLNSPSIVSTFGYKVSQGDLLSLEGSWRESVLITCDIPKGPKNQYISVV